MRLCHKFSGIQNPTANSTRNQEQKCDVDDTYHITANNSEEFHPTVQKYTPTGVRAVKLIENPGQMNSGLQSLADAMRFKPGMKEQELRSKFVWELPNSEKKTKLLMNFLNTQAYLNYEKRDNESFMFEAFHNESSETKMSIVYLINEEDNSENKQIIARFPSYSKYSSAKQFAAVHSVVHF